MNARADEHAGRLAAGERRAAGRCLWCLHGAVGMAGDWAGLEVANWRREAVDLWELLADGSPSLAEAARRINARAAAGAVLLGYSLGGRLALHGLLEPDHPWRAAVIVSAHPGLEAPDERAARLAADAGWAARVAEDWDGFLDAWAAQPVLAESRLPDRGRLWPRRRELARSFEAWSLGVQEPLWERLAEIRVPVLWVAGGRDAKFAAVAERAAGSTPRGECRVVGDVGHRVPWESPAAFAGLVAEFLERTAG